jgi:translocation and assembly module TamA
LGPLNSVGEVRGGRYLAVLSGELERRLSERFALAGFVDVGNAFDGGIDAKTSLGAGLRWRSPVGLIRLDVAYALDDDDSPVRLHLVLGPDL